MSGEARRFCFGRPLEFSTSAPDRSAKDVFPHRDRNPLRNLISSDPMSGAGTEDKKPRLAEHEVEHVVSIMEMVRV